MSNFPISQPNLTETSDPTVTLKNSGHTALHNNTAKEVDAIAAKVGVDSSADPTTLDYKLKSTSSVDPGHKHTAAGLQSDSVTTVKILDSNVTTAKINDSAVTTAKINDGAVTAAKIPDDTLTPAKLLLGQDTTTIATEETTTSITYGDLSTAGPTISYTAPASQTVLLLYGAYVSNAAIGNTTFFTVDISGATTLSGSDSNAARIRPSGTAGQEVVSLQRALLTTLNAGANTIQLKYRVEVNTSAGSFGGRYLIMIPLA